MYFYISDLHFFHERIMQLSNRPFHNVEEMHETIINNWNRVVSPKDKVFIVGDLGFYHQKEIAAIIRNLHGRKVLILGNHDPKNLRDKELHACFEEVVPYKEVSDNGRRIVLFHYPIEEWNGYFRDYYHIHGHVHNHVDSLKVFPKRFNVSVEMVNYTPRTLDELIAHANSELPW